MDTATLNAFCRAINEAKWDCAPLLVFADWWEEQGKDASRIRKKAADLAKVHKLARLFGWELRADGYYTYYCKQNAHALLNRCIVLNIKGDFLEYCIGMESMWHRMYGAPSFKIQWGTRTFETSNMKFVGEHRGPATAKLVCEPQGHISDESAMANAVHKLLGGA